MYSHEIKELLEYKKYLLKVEEYLLICNTSPQINRVKYNAYDDSFEIWTDDKYYWNFKLEKKCKN